MEKLTPRLRTYELRSQEGKKKYTQSKTNTHLTLSYKNYLQKCATPPLPLDKGKDTGIPVGILRHTQKTKFFFGLSRLFSVDCVISYHSQAIWYKRESDRGKGYFWHKHP